MGVGFISIQEFKKSPKHGGIPNKDSVIIAEPKFFKKRNQFLDTHTSVWYKKI